MKTIYQLPEAKIVEANVELDPDITDGLQQLLERPADLFSMIRELEAKIKTAKQLSQRILRDTGYEPLIAESTWLGDAIKDTDTQLAKLRKPIDTAITELNGPVHHLAYSKPMHVTISGDSINGGKPVIEKLEAQTLIPSAGGVVLFREGETDEDGTIAAFARIAEGNDSGLVVASSQIAGFRCAELLVKRLGFQPL